MVVAVVVVVDAVTFVVMDVAGDVVVVVDGVVVDEVVVLDVDICVADVLDVDVV